MDSDQVFDRRKFDYGTLQGGTAPTKTPRVDAWAADNINGPDFIRADDARTLETELTAARAEADELARRVAADMLGYSHVSHDNWISNTITRVRAEMFKQQQEKDLKS